MERVGERREEEYEEEYEEELLVNGGDELAELLAM